VARTELRGKGATRTCEQCHGSGRWYGRGVIENGVFKGVQGPCYQCNGTGRQTLKDVARTIVYYAHHWRPLSA
jgi:DnaJ-class molecular chaperone